MLGNGGRTNAVGQLIEAIEQQGDSPLTQVALKGWCRKRYRYLAARKFPGDQLEDIDSAV